MDSDLSIPYYHTAPSYEEFWNKHLITNLPCVIGPSMTQDWKSRKEWIVPTNNENKEKPQFKPDYNYLRDRFGSASGQVAKCNKRHFTDQVRVKTSFKDFADLWEADDGKESLYYLKDLHLMKTFPEDKFYSVPELFEDDWLNEYWNKEGNDDYKFSYMGGHTTFTPLHADVYRSYSWSSNICGIKKWTFFPPGQEHLFQDKFGNMVYDIRKVDAEEFPKFEQARRVVLYQKDGETVFVPSGWFHQVENIGAAISLNHNWVNANNLKYAYQSLKKDLGDCTKAIEDIKDGMSEVEFVQECQQLLLVHSGWDWKTFLKMLHCIIKNRRNSLVNNEFLKNQPSLKWQMEQINIVLDQWTSDEGEKLLNYFKNYEDGALYKIYTELKENIDFIYSKA